MTKQELCTHLLTKGLKDLPPEISNWNYSMFGRRFHRVFLPRSFDSTTRMIYDSEQVLIKDDKVTIPKDYLIPLGSLRDQFFIFINGRRHRVYDGNKADRRGFGSEKNS